MNWADEHYVKLYTRPTLTWRAWGWEARTTFLHLVKAVDHSGFIETGKMDPVDALVLQLDLPAAVVRPGLAELVESGTVELVDRAVLLPKFVEAQEAKKSEAQKKRDFRERTIARRRAQIVDVVRALVPSVEPVGTAMDPPAQPCPALLKAMSTKVDEPEPPKPEGPVERIFAKYQQAAKAPRSKLDPKRRRLIKQRLDEGFTELELLKALDGYAGSAWHHGENDRHEKYTNLHLWFRDADHVEAGIAKAAGPPSALANPPKPIQTTLTPYPEQFL